MAKKSNVSIPAIQIIRVIVFLCIGFILFVAYTKSVEFLKESPLFTVRDVMIDTSIQFIDLPELRRLKGRNIFTVDLLKVQKRIKSQYPQIAQLRVIRQLPDRIKVLAKQRHPFFQVFQRGKLLLVDNEGVALYYASPPVELPLVKGNGMGSRVILGAPLNAKFVGPAIGILKGFLSRPHLARLKMTEMDMSNPSRIDAAFGGFHVILDQENYLAKLAILETLLAQKKIDFNQVKYIDLRFNEPVMGEVPDQSNS